VLLPHTTAFNAAAAADLLAPISDVFGAPAGAGLWDFAARIGAPLRLADLGLTEADLDRAADIALKNAYWNPRPFSRNDIRDLLQAAFEGRRPTN
jgi:maleylacetate reductase